MGYKYILQLTIPNKQRKSFAAITFYHLRVNYRKQTRPKFTKVHWIANLLHMQNPRNSYLLFPWGVCGTHSLRRIIWTMNSIKKTLNFGRTVTSNELSLQCENLTHLEITDSKDALQSTTELQLYITHS